MEPPEDKLLIACLTDTANGHLNTDDIWINVKTNIAMKLAIKENMKKPELPVKQCYELFAEFYFLFFSLFLFFSYLISPDLIEHLRVQ